MIRLSNTDLAALRKLVTDRRHIPSTANLSTFVGVRLEHLERLLDELEERRRGESYFPAEAPTGDLRPVSEEHP